MEISYVNQKEFTIPGEAVDRLILVDRFRHNRALQRPVIQSKHVSRLVDPDCSWGIFLD
jgi:hypothetical protein